jgi:hypothetical protein
MPTPLLIVRLLLDAREEFRRVSEAVPNPGRGGAIGRLNAGSFIVAHIASQDDRVWNAGAQGLAGDAWLSDANAGHGAPRSTPDYVEALAALDRTFARSAPFLEALTETELDQPLSSDVPGRTIGAQLARSIGHTWAHAGELSALASLVGAPDLGLPGRLPHSSGEGSEA